MKEFVIPFFGLKIGKHEFDFQIGQAFFEAFENSEITRSEILVRLELEKSTNMLILQFEAEGSFESACDRCALPIDVPFTASERVIVKFGDEAYEETDEIILLSHDTHEIDVAHRIYEMILLNLPLKRVHEDIKDCDPSVIERLSIDKSSEEEPIDPRWEALKKLK
jgi:uncharacterized metal-binding protein YceD (DUF177 family)